MFKTLNCILGIYGVFILIGASIFYLNGELSFLSEGALVLKVVTSIIRSIAFMSCAFFAWYKPKLCFPLALMGFVTFVVGATGDVIFRHGFFGGVKTLIPGFYTISILQIAVVFLVYIFRPRFNYGANG